MINALQARRIYEDNARRECEVNSVLEQVENEIINAAQDCCDCTQLEFDKEDEMNEVISSLTDSGYDIHIISDYSVPYSIMVCW